MNTDSSEGTQKAKLIRVQPELAKQNIGRRQTAAPGTQCACLNNNLLASQGAGMVSCKQLPERNDSAPPGGVLAPRDAMQLQWLQQVQDDCLQC